VNSRYPSRTTDLFEPKDTYLTLLDVSSMRGPHPTVFVAPFFSFLNLRLPQQIRQIHHRTSPSITTDHAASASPTIIPCVRSRPSHCSSLPPSPSRSPMLPNRLRTHYQRRRVATCARITEAVMTTKLQVWLVSQETSSPPSSQPFNRRSPRRPCRHRQLCQLLLVQVLVVALSGPPRQPRRLLSLSISSLQRQHRPLQTPRPTPCPALSTP
jgi:hypothetical protein